MHLIDKLVIHFHLFLVVKTNALRNSAISIGDHQAKEYPCRNFYITESFFLFISLY